MGEKMDKKETPVKKVNKKPEKKPDKKALQAAPKAKEKEKNVSGNRLMLLITIVNRKKAEYYADLMQGMGANLSFVAMGEGTAPPGMLEMLGLTDSLKAVVFSVIKESSQKEVLRTLDDKFSSIRDGKGIAFTIPFSSVIGASVFNFLSDNRMHFK